MAISCSVNLVIVGDGFSGKTSLLNVFCTDSYEEIFEPTFSDTYEKQVTLDNNIVDVTIGDTWYEGNHTYLLPMIYQDTNAILITFALDVPESMNKVMVKWVPDAKRYCSGVPIVVVGTRKDLRDHPVTVHRLAANTQEPICFDQGRDLAAKVKAFAYLECSAKTKDEVNRVFETAARAALRAIKNDRRKHDFNVSGCNMRYNRMASVL